MANNYNQVNVLIRMLQFFPVIFLRMIGSNKISSLEQDIEIQKIPGLQKEVAALQIELRGANVVIHIMTARIGGVCPISENDVINARKNTVLVKENNGLGVFIYKIRKIGNTK